MMCGPSAAQQTELFLEYNLPGRLDSFLKATPNASLATKALGKLAGFQDGLMGAESHVARKADVTATFTAVAASSPADPSLKAKGIEVRFEYLDEHGDKKPYEVVYLDEDGLLPFQDRLGELVEIQTFALRHLQDFRPDEFPTCHVEPVINRVRGAEQILGQKADKAFVLVAGWYWKAGETSVGVAETGVCIHSNPGVASFFPSATLHELIEMVAKGRAFLAAN
jgi:hypothetical protein